MAIPSIDSIISTYAGKNYLAHEPMVREMSEKIKYLPSQLPPEELQRNVALLSVWPLVEKYRLLEEGIERDLLQTDLLKIIELDAKYEALRATRDFEKPPATEVFYLHPYQIHKTNFLRTALTKMCDPLAAHIKNTPKSRDKLYDDVLMGGSLYLIGQSDKQRFMQRSFICVSSTKEPVLFMDCIEGGQEHFKTLDDWREEGRVHHVHYAVAAALQLADMLDIGTVVPRDFELVELSAKLGLRERSIFSKEDRDWKIGLHSRRVQTGVYTHSLYRGTRNNGGHQLRHRIIQQPPQRSSTEMYARIEQLSDIIIQQNDGRRKAAPRTAQRLQTLLALQQLLDAFPETPESRRERARTLVAKVQQSLPTAQN